MADFPLTLICRGAKVPDDGSRWWQELPEGQSAESLRAVGYEVVPLVPFEEGSAPSAEMPKLDCCDSCLRPRSKPHLRQFADGEGTTLCTDCIIAAVEAERDVRVAPERLQAVEEEREELRSLAIVNGGESAKWATRAEAAEAKLKEAEEALRDIEISSDDHAEAMLIARNTRAALSRDPEQTKEPR